MGSLPRVSGAEAVRALERLGFAVVRQRGSHIVMRRGSIGCVVPNHRELKLGTLTGVLKQAGVPPDEFLAALRRSS
jgi:predicted RNA binding protein YcfA (HicA-like mRNA interferase family)